MRRGPALLKEQAPLKRVRYGTLGDWVRREISTFVPRDRSQNQRLPRMASFAALATRNFTTRFAAILIGSPVCGFRPMRAFRFANTSLPSPGTTNGRPLFASL